MIANIDPNFRAKARSGQTSARNVAFFWGLVCVLCAAANADPKNAAFFFGRGKRERMRLMQNILPH
jgi:hypothetical protein